MKKESFFTNKIKITFLVGIGVLAVVLYMLSTGLLKSNSPTQERNTGKLQVTTSFYPLYYFASQIGGDKAVVINITPASAEPHDYEPTTQDIAVISKSDLLVLNGGKLEAWGDKIRDQLQGGETTIIVAGDGLANQQVDEDGQQIQDPHIWLSSPLAKKEVEKIAAGFIQKDPQNQSYYQANLTNLDQKLDQLDSAFTNGLKSCGLREFVTSHAAFGYMASRYNLTQIPISGVSPDQEPTAQKLVEITNLIEQKNIKYIFFESLVSPKLAQTLAQETGAQTLVLDPIEGLTQDDLNGGKDYITQMNMDLQNLQTALECNK